MTRLLRGAIDWVAPDEDSKLADDLARRVRLGAWVTIGSNLTFAVADLWLEHPRWALLESLKLVQIAAMAWALRRVAGQPSVRTVVASALTGTSVIYLAVAASGYLTDDVATSPLLFVMLAIATGSLLAWGWRAQLTSVAVGSVAIFAGAFFAHPDPSVARVYQTLAVVTAFLASVWIARAVSLDAGTKRLAATAHAALRRSEALLESLFNSVDAYIGIYELLDDDFRIVSVNRALAKFYGLDPDDAVGVTGSAFAAEEGDRQRWLSHLRRAADSGETVRVSDSVGPVESATHYEASLTPIDDGIGPHPRIAMVGVDVTARQRAEERLRELNRELEGRVQERTAQLVAANRELESFAYTVSHDLRTPLRTIEGFARVVEEDHSHQMDEDALRHLERIRAGSAEMSELIDDLLEMSRVARRQLRHGAVDLAELAREHLERLRAASPTRSVASRVDALPAVSGDGRLLDLVVRNLLDNAWKYSAKTDRAAIDVTCEHAGDGRIVVAVRDNGCGFDMDHAERLFQPFQRLHRKDEYEGTGIGLATASRIVERHGGRLWAESAPGEGATFYLQLDAAPENPQPTALG